MRYLCVLIDVICKVLLSIRTQHMQVIDSFIILVNCLSAQSSSTSKVLAYISSVPKHWTVGISKNFKNLARDGTEVMTVLPLNAS